jgi:hypothetical protein
VTRVATSGDLRLLLRREVGRLRARESRRVFHPSVSIGQLAGERDSFVVRSQDLPVVDAALRTDIVSAMLESADPLWRTGWWTRPGGVDPHDSDFAWLSATRAAFAIHGRDLDAFYVITRAGWRDVLDGEQRVWARLRL